MHLEPSQSVKIINIFSASSKRNSPHVVTLNSLQDLYIAYKLRIRDLVCIFLDWPTYVLKARKAIYCHVT